MFETLFSDNKLLLKLNLILVVSKSLIQILENRSKYEMIDLLFKFIIRKGCVIN